MKIAAVCCLLACGFASGQTKKYAAPRNANGQPDLQGIWEVRNTAAGGLEAHGASRGIRAGNSVIVDPPDGLIPYKPEALAKRDSNFQNRAKLDPLNKCYIPGIPRANYLPFPFQIFQTADFVAMTYEFAHASRTIYLKRPNHLDGIDFWMADSRGRFEGDSLVIDVSSANDQTWLDASGNYHSDALHVVERYTRTSPDTLEYEATIEDPKVYSKPWKIRMPLYRHTEPDAQIFEYECHVYLEGEAKP